MQCLLNVSTLYFRKFFLDAIPMTGTVNSLKLMVQLLVTKEVTGIEADMWLTTLAFIQQPTMDMIAEVKVIPEFLSILC